MLEPLDGPSAQATLSVTTGAVSEVRAGGSSLIDRKVVTLQPLDGRVYLYFGDGTGAPSVATVTNNGILLFNRAKESFEASTMQDLWVVAVNSTTDLRVVERA